MSDVALLGRQVGYEQRSFWRNPAAAGFSFVFPILLLLIFASTGSGGRITTLGNPPINFVQYYIPAIVAFGVMGACFTNLAVNITYKRESGVLKRVRGTPLPPWAYLGGVIGNSVIVSVILAALVTAMGMIFYGVSFPPHPLALILALAVGAATFCTLGLAMTTVIPNEDAAPAVVNIIFFPLVAISGVFFPVRRGSTLARLGSFFPMKHFIDATFSGFDPRVHGNAILGSSLGIMAIWAVAGLFFAIRRFRWEPRTH